MKSLIFAVCIMISGAAYAATVPTATTSCPSGTTKVTLPFLIWKPYNGTTSCPDGYQDVYYNEYNYGHILGLATGTYSDTGGTFTVSDFCPLTE